MIQGPCAPAKPGAVRRLRALAPRTAAAVRHRAHGGPARGSFTSNFRTRCIAVLVLVAVVVVAQNFLHEAVVDTAFAAASQAMGTADQAAVRELAGTLLVVAAAVAERDEPLGQVPSARHCGSAGV